MATIDLTRSSTYFTKHYQSVRAQQGRVLSDDDHNDNERIHSEDMRRSRVDIIGSVGTPDDGFLIANPVVTGGFIDFDILPGTMYVGGNRLELETKETYQAQFDWLNMPASAMIAPPAAGSTRFDFVALETWLQPASAIEDSECFETAFGGPDTAARMRVIQRVIVASDIPDEDCASGWAALSSTWSAEGLTVSPENELIPDATLTVGFAPGSDPGDLCSPPVAGGYLGAFNQAIRVQIVDSSHFTWGFDNASPLYRVQVSMNALGQPKIVNMLSTPKDQPHWPVSGQTVEVLAWSAVLVNGEKLSEFSGFLTKVNASYDPDTNQFSMVDALPALFGTQWQGRPDAPQLGKNVFLYLRVWNRASDTLSPSAISFVPGTPATLGQTGLSVTFAGTGFATGDHWIIAARPDTPNQVVPWSLQSGRGPHGLRRYVAALGVIAWDATGAAVTGTVAHDCRDTFPPLTRLRSCCTYTVGDGVTTFGKFTSIQKAIDALPGSGGEICILPGTYKEHIVIRDLHDVVIHGCDEFTVIADDGKPGLPLITIFDSQRISIHRLSMLATVNQAILVATEISIPKGNPGPQKIHMENIGFSVRDRSAIEIDAGQYMRIWQNDIQIQELLKPLDNGSNIGKEPAIFSRADDVLIEQNLIICHFLRRLVSALGGIQIGGGSERVDIHRNKIVGGNGNGITLGSFSMVSPAGAAGGDGGAGSSSSGSDGGFQIVVDANGCIHIIPDPGNPGGNNPQTPVSDGNLVDIRIVANDIDNMGTNGIACVRLSSANFGLIVVVDCQIELNRIRGCMQLEPGPVATGPLGFTSAFGGVIFAGVEYLTLRDNWIEDNGTSFVVPNCGFFCQLGLGLVIEGNQIERNGPLGDSQGVPLVGARAGIYMSIILSPLNARTVDTKVTGFEAGFPAMRVANNVVVAPMGPALFALGAGEMLIEANNFCSHAADGSLLTGAIAFSGTTVVIANLGKAVEVASAKFDYTTVGSSLSSARGATTAFFPGPVSCNDNQILFEPLIQARGAWFSSIFILSADDISLSDNQSQCLSARLALLCNAFVLALTVRIADNRFAEGAATVFLSAFTIAAMNSTTDNQGTHCFLIAGLAVLTVRTPNASFVDLTPSGTCAELARTLDKDFAASGLTTV
jgi:Family of unknown function (DUF6519)